MCQIEVCVALISFHNSKYIFSCLESIYKYTSGVTLNVRIISNNSSKEHLELIKKLFPKVDIIDLSEDLSHSSNNNKILEGSRSKYYLIINDDIYINSNIIYEMVNYLEKNPDVGCMSPMIISQNGEFSYGFYSDKNFFEWLEIQFGITGIKCRFFPKNMKVIREVKGCSGAFLLIRRKVWESIGGFDERIPMAPNDIDLAIRVRKKGWKVYYYGKSSIVHIGGESIKKNYKKSVKLYLKSMSEFTRRYYNFYEKIIYIPVLFIGCLMRLVMFSIFYILNSGNRTRYFAKIMEYFYIIKYLLNIEKEEI